jgi:hypothetical protein
MLKLDKHILSKSTYLRGLQCVKSLYLNKKHPELRDEITVDQQRIFDTGTAVGTLARGLFLGGEVTGPDGVPKDSRTAERTRQLIDQGCKTIYEATFIHNGVLVAVDILHNEGGKWKAYEVKSSTEVKDEHIDDTAIQHYVVTGAGLPLDDISVVYLNNQYVRQGKLALPELFGVESVLDRVMEKSGIIPGQIDTLKRVLGSGAVPKTDIGIYCDDPNPCDFHGHCWKHIPEYSIFDIANLRKNKKFELYGQGIVRIEDVPSSFRLNDKQAIQVNCWINKKDHIDRDGIRRFLGTIRYPLYFLDFETINPALPLFDNSRPYQAVPFQYSMHYREQKGGGVVYADFLAKPGKDPRPEFIRHLLADTERPGDILVYNKQFEQRILTELARDFPDHAAAIGERISRLKDLMAPFADKCWYTNEMRGSHSIKSVLPALVRDLDYKGLAIADGTAAMAAYEHLMQRASASEAKRLREALREYCKMDTYAMVRILEELESYE